MPTSKHKSLPENPENYSDKQLFDAIQKRQTWALAAIYDRYSPQLYGLSLKILKNQTLAQDVIQDVFISIWKRIDSFDPGRGTPIAWMTILCRNRCIDALRAKQGRAKKAGYLEEYPFESAALTSGDNPFANTDHAQKRERIIQALSQLPPEQRELIELAYFQGFTQSEIAKHFDIPLGTVKTRMRLGMMKLREIFEKTGLNQ